MNKSISILLNERTSVVAEGTTIFGLRDTVKLGADVVVLNGAPMREDRVLADGDAVVFIRRGEIPPEDELQALMVSRHSPGVHARIRQATVGIAGLGGLGSAIAIALARIGVGRLVLADFDVVEPSNLNRQQYFVDQIGEFKTDALAANLRRMHPYVTVETHTVRVDPQNIPEIFGDVSVMVEAFDTAEAKAMLTECWLRAKLATPLVVATGLAGYAPGNTVRTRRLGRNLIVVGDLVTAAQPGTGLMAPRVGIAAHHQANAVLRLLLGEDPVGTE